MREGEKRPHADLLPRAGAAAATIDALLNGRLQLRQPLRGHRVGSDAILLAAASPVEAGDRLIDIGAGVGAVGLALAQRCENAQALLVEIDPELAALASRNAVANNLAARARVAALDFLSAPERRNAGLIAGAADFVATNPPFFEPGGVRASPDAGRARAHVLARTKDGVAPLHRWIVAALALLAPGGGFVMIQRPEALGAILAACERRLGSLALLPIHPRADQPAHRLIVGGVKGARGPLRLLPPLALHEASGAFTRLAEAIHRGEALIDLGLQRRGNANRARVDRAASPD
jgi:tRNA1(Val) A37 N6-methylase TrmN6